MGNKEVQAVETERKPHVIKGKALKALLRDIAAADGKITPKEMEDFLAAPEPELKGLFTSTDGITIASLAAAGILALGIKNYFGEAMPAVAVVPPLTDAFLKAFEAVTNVVAQNPNLTSHIPPSLLAAAEYFTIVRGGIAEIRNVGKRKIINRRAKLEDLIEKGEANYFMDFKCTVAFIGKGDEVANKIAKEKAKKNELGDFIQIGSKKPEGSSVWGFLDEDFSKEEIFEVLDRCDFKKAGEVLLLPVENENIFLAKKNEHDTTLDKMRILISILDEYCIKNGIEKKKIIIVGARDMESVYVRKKEPGGDLKTVANPTLKDMVDHLNSNGDKRIVKIVDPTLDVILPKVIEIANGRKIVYWGTTENMEKYSENFYKKLKELGYEATNGEEVFFNYNVTNTSTLPVSIKDDICAILDPNAKDKLMQEGVPEKNILVVSDMVVEYLNNEMKKS